MLNRVPYVKIQFSNLSKNFPGLQMADGNGYYGRGSWEPKSRGRFYSDRGSWRKNYGQKSASEYGEDDGQSSRGDYNHGPPPRRARNDFNTDQNPKRHRHPSELKGRDIGMWYAMRSRGRGKKTRAPELSMDAQEISAIDSAIDDLYHDERKSVFSRLGGSGSNSSNFGIKQEALHCDPVNTDKRPWVIDTGPPEEAEADAFDRIEESDFKSAYKANIEGNKMRDIGVKIEGNSNSFFTPDEVLDLQLLEDFNKKLKYAKYKEMAEIRNRLPSFQMKNDILQLIESHQCLVLSGETGCGKTTQVSQFILDQFIENSRGSECRIVCTQPRRISAITVAERVAEERAEPLGESVGYQIRLDSVLPRSRGSVLYCTTGIVLQWLQNDPLLSDVSHLILDEIHERDTLSDFLLCIAKDLVRVRPDMKIILMSATLNADKFSSFFGDCPIVHIPGYTYPVKEYYLEDVLQITKFKFEERIRKNRNLYRSSENSDSSEKERRDYIDPYLRDLQMTGSYPSSVINELRNENSEELNLDLILHLLKHVSTSPEGAVLVFVPGWNEISKLSKMIQEDRLLGSNRFLVIPLHSLMPTVNQKQVFDRPPPGIRKIIIATNIAETSITINDIVYVIDGGKIKLTNYDKDSNVSTLLPEWISLANARQRRGRAGRVQEGVCYHLYTKIREKLLEQFQLPEIQRSHLAEVILQIKILRLGDSRTFLSKVMDPPDSKVIDTSLKMLEAINALDAKENLTPLGFHLARLPMDPLTGKMILMGAIFSCLSPIVTVAASLSFKDPFVMALGKEKLVDGIRKRFAKDTKSDHLMIASVYDQWRQSATNASQFAWNNFLSTSILNQLSNMRRQFVEHLHHLKFVDSRNPEAEELNLNSKNTRLVKAVITAGLYPNVARIVPKYGGKNKGQFRKLALPNIKSAAFHPKSVNVDVRFFEGSWTVYWERLKSTKVYLFDTTVVSNYPLLLFGQKFDYDSSKMLINVDEFVQIKCDTQVANVIKRLRGELDELLEYRISHPAFTDLRQNTKEAKLLSLIVEILSNEKDNVEQQPWHEDQYSNDDDFY